MKFLHLALIFLILLSLFSYAKGNILDDKDNRALHKKVKNLVNKLFLLQNTNDNSKKLQKEILAIMPEKVTFEREYNSMSKKQYINDRIIRKGRVKRTIRDDIAPICQYIKDGTIDCDYEERIKYIEKTDRIPQQSFKYEAGTVYKFNLKMNETGDWYINKMKTWYLMGPPRMSTLEIEKKYREELKNKSINLDLSDRDENYMLPTRATGHPDNEIPYKM